MIELSFFVAAIIFSFLLQIKRALQQEVGVLNIFSLCGLAYKLNKNSRSIKR